MARRSRSKRLRAAVEGEYDPRRPERGSAHPLRPDGGPTSPELVGTVQRPHLRELLRRAAPQLDPVTGAIYHEAPAAKYYHQAYRHGLLEHCLSVAQGVSALAATFPESTATSQSPAPCSTTSARLRRIGSVNGAIELTTRGKLLGEIPLGYYTDGATIEDYR